MAEIQTSLDWQKTAQTLQMTLIRVPEGQPRRQLIDHMVKIQTMVSELSKEEVNCRRRQKQTLKHKEQLTKINKEIDQLEQMITFTMLAGR